MRRAVTALLRVLTRVFFRRIDVVNAERVPAGLYSTSKQTFRSAAVMQFGDAIEVRGGSLEPSEVEALTQRIDDALDAVTLQADSHEALELIARGERIFSAGRFDPAEELEARRRFVEGYAWLRAHDPQRLAHLQSRVEQFAAELGG